jgi:hypothetical protein
MERARRVRRHAETRSRVIRRAAAVLVGGIGEAGIRMAETVNWTVSVQVPGGPRVAQSGAIVVDAYDKVDLTLDDGAADAEVQIQPGGPGQVQVLVISTTRPSADLTYKVNDVAAAEILLDQPVHAYMGTGPVALLDASAGPTSLFFRNDSGAPAPIQVFVGRKATP